MPDLKKSKTSVKSSKTPGQASKIAEKEKQRAEFQDYMKHMGHRVLNRKNLMSADPAKRTEFTGNIEEAILNSSLVMAHKD